MHMKKDEQSCEQWSTIKCKIKRKETRHIAAWRYNIKDWYKKPLFSSSRCWTLQACYIIIAAISVHVRKESRLSVAPRVARLSAATSLSITRCRLWWCLRTRANHLRRLTECILMTRIYLACSLFSFFFYFGSHTCLNEYEPWIEIWRSP